VDNKSGFLLSAKVVIIKRGDKLLLNMGCCVDVSGMNV
jgi:hypothetical protein